jgi:hypothetical protein
VSNIKRIQDDIEIVRELLTESIHTLDNLTDNKIVYISKQLDDLINDYNKLTDSLK